MKKISILLIFILLATTVLVACDPTRVERNVVDPDTDVSTKIDMSILLPYVSENMSSNAAIPLLETLTGYKVDYRQLPSGAAAETELNTSIFIDKPTTYNAIKLTKNQFNRRATEAASLADLTDIVNSPKYSIVKNAIKQEAWDAVTVDGKILGIPDSASNDNIDKAIIIRLDYLIQLVNPDTNQKYQSADEIVDFEDFVNMLTAFKNANPAGVSDSALAPFSLPQNIQVVGPIASAFGVEQLWQDIDGELVFAGENEKFGDYIDAMLQLRDAGLLDMQMQTNSFATCADKFVDGRSIATVSNFWEMASVFDKLSSKNKVPANCVDFVNGLTNSQGQRKTWQSGGVTYVTVVPNWMADTGAHVVNYINEKIKDDNFTQLVAGTKGVDWDEDMFGDYYPKEGFAGKKTSADHFVTGTNDIIYGKLWREVVVQGVPAYAFQWNATNKNAIANGVIGVKNPLGYAPPFAIYSKSAAGIEDEFYGNVTKAIYGDRSVTAETIASAFNSATNAAAIKEVKDWYKNK